MSGMAAAALFCLSLVVAAVSSSSSVGDTVDHDAFLSMVTLHVQQQHFVQCIVQLNKIEDRDRLASEFDLPFVRYIPRQQGYLMVMPQSRFQQLQSQQQQQNIQLQRRSPTHKIESRLKNAMMLRRKGVEAHFTVWILLTSPDIWHHGEFDTDGFVHLLTARWPHISFQAASSRKIIAKCLASSCQLEQFTSSLAEHPIVETLELQLKRTKRNYFAVKALVEGGSFANMSSPWNTNYAYDMGLTGVNQVLGVADSGVEPDSCYFWDPQNPQNPAASIVDFTRRKIVSYFRYTGKSCGLNDNQPCGDDRDDTEGHGTHVSGSLLGKAYGTAEPRLIQHNGMAHNAQLAFTDIGLTPNTDGSLNPPADLNAGLFPDPYWRAGARIHSNSWGSSDNSYSSGAMEIDQFVWDHPDLLVLVAAGNDGDTADSATIGEPATCKNCLAVGAAWVNSGANVQAVAFMNATSVLCDNDQLLNSTCCKAKRCLLDDCCSTSLTSDCCVALYNTSSISFSDLASFSSRGPAAPLNSPRFKPDLVAPGVNIISANADGNIATNSSGGPQCYLPSLSNQTYSSSSALKVLSGTSMATPLLAGAAALVRQYFTDGWYPLGYPSSANQLMPTAALVKAMLIAAAVPEAGRLIGNPVISLPTSANPNYYSGYGMPQLSFVLRKASASSYSLWVNDFNSRGLNTGDYVEWIASGVTATSSLPLRAVLVWTDPPAGVDNTDVLVNDLDLSLSTPTAVYYGNGGTFPDRNNNVERVWISSYQGVLRIKVSANVVPVSTQKFALVVAGGFSSIYASALCGNGVRDSGEGCDDGNAINGDGCSSDCTVESGYTCILSSGGNSRDVCSCSVGFFGSGCSSACSSATNCNNNGVCTTSAGAPKGWRCDCNGLDASGKPYLGSDCSILVTSYTRVFVSKNVSVNYQAVYLGNDSLLVPPGATSSDLTIQMSYVPSTALPAVGNGLAISGYIRDFKPEGTTFQAPVALTIFLNATVDPTTGLVPSIYYFNPDTWKWEKVGGNYQSKGFVSVSISHFSAYGVVYEKSSILTSSISASALSFGKLSDAATAGIGIATCVTVLGFIGVMSWFILRSRKRRTLTLPPPRPAPSVDIITPVPVISSMYDRAVTALHEQQQRETASVSAV